MVELKEALYNRETSASGTFAIIIVRLRPAEVRHHAITEVLGDMATIAGYRMVSRTQ
jgi:hypothetical protein